MTELSLTDRIEPLPQISNHGNSVLDFFKPALQKSIIQEPKQRSGPVQKFEVAKLLNPVTLAVTVSNISQFAYNANIDKTLISLPIQQKLAQVKENPSQPKISDKFHSIVPRNGLLQDLVKSFKNDPHLNTQVLKLQPQPQPLRPNFDHHSSGFTMKLKPAF